LYGDFKREVADVTAAFLTTFQDRLAKVSQDEVTKPLERSEESMRAVATDTLLRVQKAIGLR